MVVLMVALLLAGCVSTPQSEQLLASAAAGSGELSLSRELDEVAFYPQDAYQCGPAALATLVSPAGLSVSPEELKDEVYIPDRQGSLQAEMLAATRRLQLLPVLIAPTLATLLAEIDAGNPVLVMQNLGPGWMPNWHYAVAVGYDLQAGEIVLRSGTIRRRVTPLSVFENTWRRSGFWGFVALQPGQLSATLTEQHYVAALADYLEHAENTRATLAARAGVTRWPGNTLLRMMLAETYAGGGDTVSAEAAYRDLLEYHPEYAPAHNNLALLLSARGEQQQALQHARRAVSLGGRYADEYRATLKEIQSRF